MKSIGESIKAHFTTAVGLAKVALSATTYSAERGVLIQSDEANTGVIYIGDTAVTTANGIFLKNPGDAIFLPLDNPGPQVNLISNVAAQKVRCFII